MDEIINWIITNRTWFFSGIGIAIPIAFIGWRIKNGRAGVNQSVRGGHSSNYMQAGGDINIQNNDDTNTQNALRSRDLSDFRKTIYQAAYEYDEHMEDAHRYGKLGDIEAGREAFFKAARSQRDIVTAYKLNSRP